MASFVQKLNRWLQLTGWKTSSAPTPAEMQILCAFHSQSDARILKFFRQWRSAEFVTRSFLNEQQSRYELRWHRTPALLSHNCLFEPIISRPLIVHTSVSPTPLSFVLHVQPGGWCGPLIGETVDGSPLPLRWSLQSGDDQRPPWPGGKPLLILPAVADGLAGQKRIRRYADLPDDFELVGDYWEIFDPATDEQIRECEQRLGFPLPADYIDFVRCSNGILIGETYIPGTGRMAPPPFNLEDRTTTLFLGEDIVNGLADGGWCMPTTGPDAGRVVQYSMYGDREPHTTTLREFVRERVADLSRFDTGSEDWATKGRAAPTG